MTQYCDSQDILWPTSPRCREDRIPLTASVSVVYLITVFESFLSPTFRFVSDLRLLIETRSPRDYHGSRVRLDFLGSGSTIQVRYPWIQST
jgi:hypothetical protein